MSKGALMFAYNNDFDYLSMADVAAGLVKKNLGIPTTVVTDEASIKGKNVKYIDNIVTKEALGGNTRSFMLPGSTITTTWRNLNRSDAYELSPYDQTLMFVKVIRENYRYYSLLYNFPQRPFRNDFAFSIALHTLSGYTTDRRHFFPWAMPSMTTRASVLDYRPELNEIVYEYPVAGKTYTHGVSKSRDMDLHLMNKLDVTDNNLLDKIRKYIDAETE